MRLTRLILAIACLLTSLSVTAAGAEPVRPTPVRAGAPQHGITLWGWTPTAYAEPAALSALDGIAATGAGWVTLVPMWFQPTPDSSRITPDPAVTTSDSALASAVRAAHKRGLEVTIKPQVDVLDGSWRGDIRPADSAAWFTSYAAMLDHYARLGSALGVRQLVVGTELVGVSDQTAAWTRLIAATRVVFGGLLTYAALPFEYDRIEFWRRLDLIGVNAYWPLADRGTTNVAALQQAWVPHVRALEAFAQSQQRPVLLTEAGYASQAGTATDPSSWTLSRIAAPREQAAAYEALFLSFEGRPWFAGVHWWAWRATNDPAPLDFTPQGKAAERVLRTHWLSASRPSPRPSFVWRRSGRSADRLGDLGGLARP